MTNFLTSWHIFDVLTYHDVFLTSWCNFYIMTNFLISRLFLTSWSTFWSIFDVMYFWRHDKLFEFLMHFLLYDELFDGTTNCFCHDELVDVMTNLLTSWCILDVMTSFLTSLHIFDIMMNVINFLSRYTFWHISDVKFFEVMTNVLFHDIFCVSWRTALCHDKSFDVMTNIWMS